MRYRYLTRSFVEALGLDLVPISFARNNVVRGWPRFDGTASWLLPAGQANTGIGVQFEGRWYAREADGLAFAATGWP